MCIVAHKKIIWCDQKASISRSIGIPELPCLSKYMIVRTNDCIAIVERQRSSSLPSCDATSISWRRRYKAKLSLSIRTNWITSIRICSPCPCCKSATVETIGLPPKAMLNCSIVDLKNTYGGGMQEPTNDWSAMSSLRASFALVARSLFVSRIWRVTQLARNVAWTVAPKLPTVVKSRGAGACHPLGPGKTSSGTRKSSLTRK